MSEATKIIDEAVKTIVEREAKHGIYSRYGQDGRWRQNSARHRQGA